MRPAIEAVRATGTTVAEVALCYTGDLSDPDETALHARLLPRPGRADRRRRRARAGDQGHGRPAAGARRAHPGHRAARASSTCPCTCTPTTPPVASSPRCSPRSTPGSTRSTPPAPRWPAPRRSRRCPRWCRPPTTPPRDRPVAGRGQRARALLGGHPPGLRALRVRPAGTHRSRLPPRDPRRPALQPAPAGDRARPRREVRAGRGHVRRGQRHPRQRRQGDPLVQGGRRPRPRTWSAVGADPAGVRRTTRAPSTSPTR